MTKLNKCFLNPMRVVYNRLIRLLLATLWAERNRCFLRRSTDIGQRHLAGQIHHPKSAHSNQSPDPCGSFRK